jgi:hypothetical protein
VSLATGQTTVGVTATYIATGLVGASWITLHVDGNENIFIGGADVTTGTGFEVHKGSTLTVWLPETDKLYAVVTSGTHTLTWMQSGGR